MQSSAGIVCWRIPALLVLVRRGHCCDDDDDDDDDGDDVLTLAHFITEIPPMVSKQAAM